MKHTRTTRILAAMLLCILVLTLLPADARAAGVTDEASLLAALGAASSGDTVSFDAGVSSITITGDLTIPVGVTLDLNAYGSATLAITGGTTAVYGTIAGGAVSISGGTLVKAAGSSVTATLTTSGTGCVRESRILALENFTPGSSEVIQSVRYTGVASADTSAFITYAPTDVIYPLAGKVISEVTTYDVSTQATYAYRLGSRNTETLSLTYAITYADVQGASFASANPTSYTASDAAFALMNPSKQGYDFVGWTCAVLSLQEAINAVVPEGTRGALTFTAVWAQQQQQLPTGGSGRGALSAGTGSISVAEQQSDTEPETEAAPAQTSQPESAAESNVRISRGVSSTKVVFTDDDKPVLPSSLTVQTQTAFPWGLCVLLGLGAAVVIGATAYLLREKK